MNSLFAHQIQIVNEKKNRGGVDKNNFSTIFLFKSNKKVFVLFLAIWSWESSIEILLAINRCVEVGFSKHSDRIYGGYRTWLWILPTAFYASYIFLFEKPTVFSGIGFAWFFSPFIGIRNLSAAEIDVIL